MAEQRQYDDEYKVQAVRLAEKIGHSKTAEEFGDPQEHFVRLGQKSTVWLHISLQRHPKLRKRDEPGRRAERAA